MSEQSVIDRIRQLDAEKAKLLSEAKKEALKKVEDAISELHSLGFTNYRLQEVGADPDPRKIRRTASSDRECQICQFKTNPPHDGRKHRSQTIKKPFTDAELHDLGLEKA